jgi:PAS domain S-box-containing protein
MCTLVCAMVGLSSSRERKYPVESAWESVLNRADCGSFTVNYRSGAVQTSVAWNDLLGYRAENAPRSRAAFLQLIEPADRELVDRAIHGHAGSQTDHIFYEARIRRGDGRTQWIRCRAKIVERDDTGAPVQALGMHVDIDSVRRESEEKAEHARFMELILSSIPTHIAVIDQRGKVVLTNDYWKRFAEIPGTLGERPAVGSNYLQRLQAIRGEQAPLAARALQIVERLIQGVERLGQMEYEIGEGADRLSFVIKLIRFDLPTGPCITVTHRDITEQRRIERSLRESEERWKFAIDGSGDAIWDWDLERNSVHRSAQYFKMLGMGAEEGPPGFDMRDFVHPEDLALLDSKYENVISGTQDLCAFEHRMRHTSGSWRWIMARCTVMRRNAGGRATRILGVHTDITSLKEVESQLRAQQEENRKLALVAEHTTNSVVITDSAGVIDWVNRAFEVTTGYRLDEVRGRMFDDVLQGPDSSAEVIALVRAKIGAGEPVRVKILNFRKDKRPFWGSVEIQPIRDSTGGVLHFVGVMEDITEREKMEAERRLSQKLESVGQLASGIAHEINTPIQFVGDSITFLDEAWQSIEPLVDAARLDPGAAGEIDGAADNPEVELRNADVDFLLENFPIAIARARDGVDRVSSIVRAMKGFAHPDHGELVKTDVNQALRDTVIVARNEYKYVGTLTIECGTLPLVRCRISSINQVLLNLIVNAAHALADRKHTPETGRIEIKSRCEQDWAVITVTDNGCGIPEEIKDRIFDPFFTSKEVGRGTGQGLTIARAIVVDQHEGRLLFRSKVGEGSAFEMWLPVAGPPISLEAAGARA